MARTGLTDHRKFKRLARVVGGRALALGSLELIWEGCYQRGDDFLGDAVDVEAAADWLGAPGVLCEALEAAGGDGPGFIERDPDRPGYRVHDLFDHAPPHVKKRVEREIVRTEAGQTLSDVRRAAGKRGAEASKRSATDQQTKITCQQVDGNQSANRPLGRVGRGEEGKGEEEDLAAMEPAAPPAPLAFDLPEPPGPKPITRDEAERRIASASAGRYLAGGRTKGGTFALDRARKSHPSVAIWERIGRWLAAGGDAWRGQLDGRSLGTSLDAWIAHAEAWDGRPIAAKSNGHATPRSNDPDLLVHPGDIAKLKELQG